MFSKAFSSEWYKITHRRTFFAMMLITGVVTFGIIMAIYGGYRITLSRGGPGNPQAEALKSFITVPGIMNVSSGIITITGLVLLVVLASTIVSEEFRWGSIRTLLATGLPRYDLLAGKAFLLALCAFILMIFGVIVAGLIGAGFSFVLSQSLPPGVTWLFFVKDLLWTGIRLGYSVLPYGMLSILVAVLTRSSGLATMIPLVSFFFVEPVLAQTVLPLLGETSSRLIMYLPSVCASAVQQGQTSEMWKPAAILALYGVVFLGAATHVLEQRDVTN